MLLSAELMRITPLKVLRSVIHTMYYKQQAQRFLRLDVGSSESQRWNRGMATSLLVATTRALTTRFWQRLLRTRT